MANIETLSHLNIFLGWDSREQVATEVAAYSIKRRTKSPIKIQYLKHRELRKAGHFARHWSIDAQDGGYRDSVDGRPFSTEFSHTRFLVPSLMKFNGWALFMDGDMIFLSDIQKLFNLVDDKYAAMVVKHSHKDIKHGAVKMDGREQLGYFRKNWSSFVLWNCSHPANKVLTKEYVSFAKGSDLHSFSWLHESLIGALPNSYNYISGVSPKLPAESGGRPDVIHYTEGGPWFPNCCDAPYAQNWIDEYEDFQRSCDGSFITETPTTVHDRREL